MLFNRAPANSSTPAICTPLTATSAGAQTTEARAVCAMQPDIIEWRADFFDGLASVDAVTALARDLRAITDKTPLLFTRRSVREGGNANAASEAQVMAAYDAVIAARLVDLIDCELGQPEQDILALRALSRSQDVAQILSFHDFSATPNNATLLALADRAEALGGDAVKIAVMPRSLEDVLRLMDVTRQIHARGTIPVISMAMGEMGRITRIAGGLFGSAMTFAAGVAASAPGQMDIESLRTAMRIVHAA
ncbi:MAG: type I 3-dehydroquinate dehydratase [Betaproteobacteria bacterium]|nr:type I 3-dehydroquinate dehydratase [Betaproteobacteria bacterium]